MLALMDEYPDEALAIVDEVQAPTARDWSIMRERMWLAREEAEIDVGRDAGLGTVLRHARERRGVTVAGLARSLEGRGIGLDASALEQLEADQGVDIDPEVWAAVVDELGLDRHHVVANIRRTLSPLRAEGEYLSGAMLSREPPGNVGRLPRSREGRARHTDGVDAWRRHRAFRPDHRGHPHGVASPRP